MSKQQLLDKLAKLPPEKREQLLKKLQAEKAKKPAPAKPARTAIQCQTWSDDERPMSFAQQRLWFLTQLDQDSTSYNIPAVLQIKGALDIDAMRRTFATIVERHEVLRYCFQEQQGQAQPRVVASGDWQLPQTDLSHLQGDGLEQACRSEIERELMQPFDLQAGPLLRTHLVKRAEQDYLLLATMHHIVSDGWSTQVLLSELAGLYSAEQQGQTAQLPPLPIQYGDFAHWQRNWLQGEALDKQLDYWEKQLADVPVLELATDFARPPVQSTHGAHAQFTLPISESQPLLDLGQQQGATPFMSLLAVFYVLLSRYSGQQDLCVGTPIANRSREELEPLIGFFVNTLGLRAQLEEQQTFAQFLQQVQQITGDAYAHQDVPFERLVEALGVSRDMSHTPIFQTVFTYTVGSPYDALPLADLEARFLPLETETAKFDLTFSFIDDKGQLSCEVEYNTDLFSAATIERMFDSYRSLVNGIVAKPQAPLAQLSALSQQQRQCLLADWNGRDVEHPQGECMPDLLRQAAEVFPDRLAMVLGEQRLTFAELERQTNQLAAVLAQRGVTAGTRVACCFQRSFAMWLAPMAVQKLGAAFIPIDSRYPALRKQQILEDAEPVCLLSHDVLANDMKALAESCQVPLLAVEDQWVDNRWYAEVAAVEQAPEVVLEPDMTAYLVYTSGSTGKPKGVIVKHRPFVNLMYWFRQRYQVSPGTRVTQLAGYGFDASIWEVWCNLQAGACMYMCDDEVRLNPEKMLQWFEQQQIARAFVPTPMLEALMKMPVPACVQQLSAGGDRLSLRPSADAHYEVINYYGPTESTVLVTCSQVEAEGVGAPTIGHPVDNVQAYILDTQQRPVPIGVPGELHVGGACLAEGYLGLADKTAEVFIDNPLYGQMPHICERLYRTGDLVRYRQDGQIEYLSRLDDQVQIRGFRVELGEVEAVMNSHPRVLESVAVVSQSAGGNAHIAAYYVSDRGTAEQPLEPLDAQELKRTLKEHLPDYMVPTAWVLMDEIPMTTNGKVDRRQLPEPELQASAAFVAPTNEIEQQLADIWLAVLDCDKVGIHDDFFELGGHSLLATQIHSRIREQFQLDLPLQTLFEVTTVAGLADLIRSLAAPVQGLDEESDEEFEEGLL